MGIRSGKEFVESLRDERTIYVGGERVKDVTTHPPFRGIVGTLASLYDFQHEHTEELTFRSPSSGDRAAASFLMARVGRADRVAHPGRADARRFHVWPDGADARFLQRAGDRPRQRRSRFGRARRAFRREHAATGASRTR
jgi:hypothetical protein